LGGGPTDRYGSIKLCDLYKAQLEACNNSDSLPPPFLEGGKKANKKDEFQNRKITTLIMNTSIPSQQRTIKGSQMENVRVFLVFFFGTCTTIKHENHNFRVKGKE
jgi:hypothetical protein